MNKYIAVLGRMPLISIAELERLFLNVKPIKDHGHKIQLAEFESEKVPDIRRLGGTIKIGVKLGETFKNLPRDRKITIGVSDFSPRTSAFMAQKEALAIKKKLVKAGHSVRVVANKTAVLSAATSLHNGLFTENKIEILKHNKDYYRVIQLSNIENYAKRDQARPARDAKVGMLPPKLAQILINLCGELPKGARLLDPFCGTGVVLQEAALMGYTPYGTDVSERMVEYSEKNLSWLSDAAHLFLDTGGRCSSKDSPSASLNQVSASKQSASSVTIEVGDATSYQWAQPIDAVACETYLGPPMSQPPAEIKLREAKQQCKSIILGFLKNLAPQIEPGTPLAIAVPAWLRPDGSYSHLNLLDEIANLRYNVYSFKNLGQKDLLYYRDGQVVAREIIVLRKI